MLTSLFLLHCASSSSINVASLEESLSRLALGHDMPCSYPSRYEWWASLTHNSIAMLEVRNPGALIQAARECLNADVSRDDTAAAAAAAAAILRRWVQHRDGDFDDEDGGGVGSCKTAETDAEKGRAAELVPSEFDMCDECVKAGFGWSIKKGKCGRGFSNQDCPADAPALPPQPPQPVPVPDTPEWDPHGGYILGCMCQGRFGNQFDYMLGFMEVAKALNRTMVLGPWIEYNARQETGQYPYFPRFTDFFRLDSIQSYHRAIDAMDFVRKFGDQWQQVGVVGFSVRPGSSSFDDGVPRRPFWQALGVKFASFDELPEYNWQSWYVVTLICCACVPEHQPTLRRSGTALVIRCWRSTAFQEITPHHAI